MPEKEDVTDATQPTRLSSEPPQATVSGLYCFPIKGFTPEPLAEVSITVHAQFPHDRIYAVEDGPSGFLAESPRHMDKTKFTVLANKPRVAQVRTRLDPETGQLTATAPGMTPLQGTLGTQEGREDFAAWLSRFLAGDAKGALRVLRAPEHRFLDHPTGYVSIVNLASVRDLERRMGKSVDPLRFRANIYVDGWLPWSELDLPRDAVFQIGTARLQVDTHITRCVATHVDPDTGIRNLDIVGALADMTPRVNCGLYAHVIQDGTLRQGSPVTRQS